MIATRSSRPAFLLVAAILLVAYGCTASPSLTFWDASEFATAIGTFGIPHPPGTPLYVALGTTLWHLVPGITPVQAGTLLSALSTAVACALAAMLVVRVTGRTAPAVIAGVCAGAMGTVWLNATETEVYSVSLLCVSVQCLLAWRAFADDDDRARVALAYVAALSVPLHLSALVATPAALLLAHTTRDGVLRWRLWLASASLVLATVLFSRAATVASGVSLIVAVALSFHRDARDTSWRWLRSGAAVTVLAWSAVLILLLRAHHLPYLNQGDPSSLARLLDVIARAQYDVAPLWPRRAPLWLQLGNVAQYADWQVALGLWNDVVPDWRRTPVTLLALVLGVAGAVAHWRTHRPTARALIVLMALATLGVVVQLNLRAGPSYGIGLLPDGAPHEARDRDYFFALAFWVWGLWIGIGAWAMARRSTRQTAVAALVPVALLAGNWRGVTRNVVPDRDIAAGIATELLLEAPRFGILFTAGDNDSYPVWYRQAVDSLRPDVRVVVTSLLPANWYFLERARAGRLTPADTLTPRTLAARGAVLARATFAQGARIGVSVALPAASRDELGRAAGVTCWQRVGLVDIGAPAEACPPRIDAARTFAAAERLQSLLAGAPRQSTDGMIDAFRNLARCPRAAVAVAVTGRAPEDSVTRRLLDLTCNLR